MKLPLFAPKSNRVERGLVAEYKMNQKNLLKYSEDFSNSNWSKSVTVTGGQADPFGGNNAWLLEDTSATAWQSLVQAVAIPNDALVRTASFYVRKGTSALNQVTLKYANGGTTIEKDYIINWITLTVSAGASIDPYVGDWYRFKSPIANNTSSNANYYFQVYPTNWTSTGDKTGTMYVAFPQLEVGPVATTYEKTTENQILKDSKGTTNIQLGSTTAGDTNDPLLTGQGVKFVTDDYAKGPNVIDVTKDFAFYLAVNVGPVTSNEYYLSLGNSGNNTPRVELVRQSTGMVFGIVNDAGAGVWSSLTASKVTPGVRLIKVYRKNNEHGIIDVGSGATVAPSASPPSPITLNQMALGCQLKISASAFMNQSEYYAALYQGSLSRAEDRQMFRYIKSLLISKGIKLGGSDVFTSDFAGKVYGSTIINPHIAMTNWEAGETLLKIPSAFTTESSQINYDKIASLDGTYAAIQNSVSGAISQVLFTFDLIRMIEVYQGCNIPGNTVADKVTWIKNNLNALSCDWHGFGQGASGYGATMAVYNWGNWSTISSNVASVVTITRGYASDIGVIQPDGKAHFLMYAPASDGVTPSNIRTDYIRLSILLKSGVVLGG